MFDLDIIENDWKNNSFKLSEEEIIKIYQSEGITQRNYNQQIDEWIKKTHLPVSAEEQLLATIFNDNTYEIQKQELLKKYPYPEKKRLSLEKQQTIIEGCMDYVFDETRYWYNYFEEKISMEKLYYICLEALINCVKYTQHCEKKVFNKLIITSIERNIVKNIAKWEHLSYKDVYKVLFKNRVLLPKNTELKLDYDNKEGLYKPSVIYEMIKNIPDTNVNDNLLEDDFKIKYNNILNNLSYIEKMTMKLSYDENGYPGLTYQEIANYLETDIKNIKNAKRRALRKIKETIN